MNNIAFPGLGIKEFKLDPIAIPNLFGTGIDVAWYGIIISLAMILAVLYVLYRAKRTDGIKADDVFDFAIWAIPLGVIGARLYYVIMQLDEYKGKPFIEYIAVWKGGIAIYGGIIGGAIGILIASRIKKIKPLKFFDMVAPAVMIAQAIGRWGNFFNGEAYGWSEGVNKLPWRMQLEGAYRTEIVNGKEVEVALDFVHPTFLYESLWNILGFVLINLFYKKKKYDGQILVMYLTWYGFGRMLIESLRTDSLYAFGSFRISQVIGFLCFFIGICLLTAMEIVRYLRKKDVLAAEKAEETPETSEEIKEEAKEENKEEKNDDGVFEIADSYVDDDDE